MREGLIETGKNLDQARHQPSRDDNGTGLQRQQLTLMLNSRPPLPLALQPGGALETGAGLGELPLHQSDQQSRTTVIHGSAR